MNPVEKNICDIKTRHLYKSTFVVYYLRFLCAKLIRFGAVTSCRGCGHIVVAAIQDAQLVIL